MNECPNCECSRCSGARTETDPLYEAINGALKLHGLVEVDAHAVADIACDMAQHLKETATLRHSLDTVVDFAEQPSVDAMRHLRHVHVAGRCVKRSAGPHCEETR